MDLVSSINAKTYRAIRKHIKSYRVAFAELSDGSVGLVRISERQFRELRERRMRDRYPDPLPEHYREISIKPK